MAYTVHLEIAGVHFAMRSPYPVATDEMGPAYGPFLREAPSAPGLVRVDVDLQVEAMPRLDGLELVFESDRAWSLLRGDDWYLKRHHPGSERPRWLARFGGDLRRVTVYCGEGLLRQADGHVTLSNPVRYPLDQLLLMYILAHNEGILLHAAGADFGGKGLLFPGQSGAGKTTIARLLAASPMVEVLSDDRMVLRKADGNYRAFGTPWPGEAQIARNQSVPLAGVFFISHAPVDEIREMGAEEALGRLLPVASVPWYDRDVMPQVLDFCGDFLQHVPAYELLFQPTSQVADLLQRVASA
jgi:hypothetical protein